MQHFLSVLVVCGALSAGSAAADPKGHPQGGPPGLADKPMAMPPGQAKKLWRSGERLPVVYYSGPTYVIVEPMRYRLHAPPPGHRWVLVDGNAYLVRTNTGLITEVVANAISRLVR